MLLFRVIPFAAVLAVAILVTGMATAKRQAPPKPPSLSLDLALALADCQELPPEERAYTRYLSASWMPDGDRRLTGAVLAFHVNSLSIESIIVKPVQVGQGLWRVVLSDYGLQERVAVWERLADVDPYYHVRAEIKEYVAPAQVLQPVYAWEESAKWPKSIWWLTKDGKWTGGAWSADEKKFIVSGATPNSWVDGGQPPIPPPGQPQAVPAIPIIDASKAIEKRRYRANAVAPWVTAQPGDSANYAQLVALTGSQSPILRADWFIYQTASAADRVAGYYDWLGLGKAQADFDKFAGVNPDKAARRRTEIGDAVRRSSVTHKAREIYRENTFYGYRWTTRDFDTTQDNKAPEDRDNNPLRLLDGKARNAATEQLATAPNGLLYAWLANGEGVRQDVAPDKVASTRNMPGWKSTDARVHSYFSCAGCHRQNGLREIDGWVRNVYFDPRSPLQLNSPDYETRRRNRQLYQQNLVVALKETQDRYARAVHECNGLTGAENAEAMLAVISDYQEQDRTLERFAAECYTTPGRLQQILLAEAAKGSLDPVLASLLAGQKMRYDDVEQAYALAQDLLRKAGGP